MLKITTLCIAILCAWISCSLAAVINEYHAGDIRILRLWDSPGGIPENALRGDAATINHALANGVCPADFVAFLVLTPNQKTLVDSGKGHALGGGAVDILKQAGIRPEDITDVVLTHLHFDHVGGMVSNGGKTFPNAKIHADAKEWEYWKNYQPQANGAPNTEMAKKFIELYQNDAQLFNAGENPMPWLKAIPTPGHTPGHMAYELENAGKTYIFGGDFMHCLDAQAKDPDIYTLWDTDHELAIRSRKELLKRAVQKNGIVLGGHFPQPGAVKFSPAGESYDYTTILPDK